MDNINILFTFAYSVGYDRILPSRQQSQLFPRISCWFFQVTLFVSYFPPLPRLSHLTILALFHMSVSVPCRKFSYNAGTARLLPLALYFKPFISHRFTLFPIPGLQPNLELGTTNGQPAKFQSPQTAFILVSKVMFSLHPLLSYPLFAYSTSSFHESLHFICVLADFTSDSHIVLHQQIPINSNHTRGPSDSICYSDSLEISGLL